MLNTRNLLAQLQLTEAEIDTYLILLKGAQSAREVIDHTGRSRPTVYYALSALERRGLITKQGNSEEYRFVVEPLSRLKMILQEQEDLLESAKLQLEEFIEINESRQSSSHRPQIIIHDGLSAIKNIIMESLYCRSQKIDSLISSDDFFWRLGSDFIEHYLDLRSTMGVATRDLFSRGVSSDNIRQHYGDIGSSQITNKIGDRFRTTLFIYDDAVLHISFLSNGYALMVRSGEHYEMIRGFYDVLWGLA